MFSQYCEFITINEYKKYNFLKVYPTFNDFFLNSNDSKIFFYDSFLEYLNSLFSKVHILKFESILDGKYKEYLYQIFEEQVETISHDNPKNKKNNAVIVQRKNIFLRYLMSLSPHLLRYVILKYIYKVKLFVLIKNYLVSLFSEKIEVKKLDSQKKDYYIRILKDSISAYEAL